MRRKRRSHCLAASDMALSTRTGERRQDDNEQLQRQDDQIIVITRPKRRPINVIIMPLMIPVYLLLLTCPPTMLLALTATGATASTMATATATATTTNEETTRSNLRFDPDANAYTGLTFTFDPKLDSQIEWLHFDHWRSIMQKSSSMLYDSLNGRAHLAEVQVLIPYKWRQSKWPIMHKPGSPIMTNRRLRYAEADVIVGPEDPVHKETPFALQHDECGKQGLNIQMPISFLEQNPNAPIETRLKARQFVREFASLRYGVFKESGFRNDLTYPPFSSVPGLSASAASQSSSGSSSSSGSGSGSRSGRWAWLTGSSQEQPQPQPQATNNNVQTNGLTGRTFGSTIEFVAAAAANASGQVTTPTLRGFDDQWQECAFEASPESGLPASAHAAACAPYLVASAATGTGAQQQQQQQPMSFNLMSSDPFSYLDLSAQRSASAALAQQPAPLYWRDIAEQTKWHFCGENFAAPIALVNSNNNIGTSGMHANSITGQVTSSAQQPIWFAEHNQRAINKQNRLCAERSALDVIRASDDFRRSSYSGSTFNRLPEPNFKFLQEMPPRIILGVEYSAHLYQSHRLDYGILESAITKFLAFDLVADSEVALVLFGQQQSSRGHFKRLDSTLESRLTLYSPPIDPFDEPAQFYTEHELSQLDFQASNTMAKLIKGTCSFGKFMNEMQTLLAQRASQYDDLGADIVLITSGLFVEDEAKIEEIIRSTFKPAEQNLRVNVIIYPSTMLFDTKAQRGSYVELDPIESESIIKSRINKLLLIQRLTNARIHLVREHLDANGDVKMSTLIHFYQIFESMSKGHSWDLTQGMAMIEQRSVESRPTAASQSQQQQTISSSPGSSASSNSIAQSTNKLTFHFELDRSVQNELIVGFIDPKQQHLHARGKRFALRNLQLKSPGGLLILTDAHPWSLNNTISLTGNGNGNNYLLHQYQSIGSDAVDSNSDATDSARNENKLSFSHGTESALFPYRNQLSLAGFYLKPSHLAQLNATNRLAGVWTLTATADEPVQTSAVAMTRVNPSGDTIVGDCWIQTYHHQPTQINDLDNNNQASGASDAQAPSGAGPLKTVKVFARVRGGSNMAHIQQVTGRLEVQDELGNIVQNVNMLDDGLGLPDITRGDGILSQYVQRAYRPGFYRVNVELSGENGRRQQSPVEAPVTHNGQDNTCCGSSVPTRQAAPDARHLSRQLYCGHFHVDSNNKLAQQKPPRVANLSIVHVDQDNRRITLRWQEPMVDISVQSQSQVQSSSLSPSSSSLSSKLHHQRLDGNELGSSIGSTSAGSGDGQSDQDINSPQAEPLRAAASTATITGTAIEQRTARAAIFDGKLSASAGIPSQQQQHQLDQLSHRYEIKLFSDRDILKRAFDAKHEVGFKFNEWNVEGVFPNSSTFGGTKEVTLRVPYSREGFYYVAMKVYNNMGLGSQLSNIVQFYLRNNLTLEEVESIYGQATTIDADGNIYDRNGDLIRGPSGGANERTGSSAVNYSLLKSGTANLDGLGILIVFSLLAFIMSVLCISLVACLAGSVRRTLVSSAKRRKADDQKAVTGGSSSITTTNGGSAQASVASGSSHCGSSQHSEVASSIGVNDVADMNKLAALNEEIVDYTRLQQAQQQQAQQAQLIQSHLLESGGKSYSQHQYDSEQQQQHQWPPHTVVNGYTYATVNNPSFATGNNKSNDGHYGTCHIGQQQQQQQQPTGDLNQDGLGAPEYVSSVQSWPADILLSHYDKVKQARERNEAPPVMRVETIEHSEDGLPTVMGSMSNEDHAGNNNNYYASARTQHSRSLSQMAPYYNAQLQQQLSSVLKSKQQQRQQQQQLISETTIQVENTSPALTGVTGELHDTNDYSGVSVTVSSQQQAILPPPPQYIYCNNGPNISHQQAAMLTDSSIYSQVTNLQQVTAPSDTYYANTQWSQQQGYGLDYANQKQGQNLAGQNSGSISEV